MFAQGRRGMLILPLLGLTMLLLGQDVGADTLITNDGKRWEGKVTVEQDGYTLTLPQGGTIRFQKSMVREAISPEIKAAEYQTMLKDADLSNDEQLMGLVAFAEQYYLVEERRNTLLSAFELRRPAAWDNIQAVGALAEWCERFRLPSGVAACKRRAGELEFPVKIAQAHSDLTRLDELATWCVELGLESALQQCLEASYAKRAEGATTARAHWELAKWSRGRKKEQWAAKQQDAAVKAAASEKDLKLLEEFLSELTTSKELSSTCVREIYGLRSGAAGKDAMARAQLSTWCMEHGLEAEAAEAESTAVSIAGDDPQVREELSYVQDPGSGKWTKFLNSVGLFKKWEFRDAAQELGFTTVRGSGPAPDFRSTTQEVHPDVGNRYLILHFLLRTPKSQWRVVHSEWVVKDESGKNHPILGVCTGESSPGAVFSPIQPGEVVSPAPNRRPQQHWCAVYFEVPQSARQLTLIYKGAEALHISTQPAQPPRRTSR